LSTALTISEVARRPIGKGGLPRIASRRNNAIFGPASARDPIICVNRVTNGISQTAGPRNALAAQGIPLSGGIEWPQTEPFGRRRRREKPELETPV
jgi:hypothetical protein